jgi:hypothetical protein
MILSNNIQNTKKTISLFFVFMLINFIFLKKNRIDKNQSNIINKNSLSFGKDVSIFDLYAYNPSIHTKNLKDIITFCAGIYHKNFDEFVNCFITKFYQEINPSQRTVLRELIPSKKNMMNPCKFIFYNHGHELYACFMIRFYQEIKPNHPIVVRELVPGKKNKIFQQMPAPISIGNI